jgi:hypothetical protein
MLSTYVFQQWVLSCATTWCDMGPRFKWWDSSKGPALTYPTMGFVHATQGSSDLHAATRTTVPRGQLKLHWILLTEMLFNSSIHQYETCHLWMFSYAKKYPIYGILTLSNSFDLIHLYQLNKYYHTPASKNVGKLCNTVKLLYTGPSENRSSCISANFFKVHAEQYSLQKKSL